jgi:uncharacterized RDD family membrane protein YckC
MPPTVFYYHPEDYLGVMKRLLIDVIDATVAGSIALFLTFFVVAFAGRVEVAVPLTFLTWAGIWVFYFVVMKRRFRTLGYVIAGAKIVDFTGERPGYLTLLGRTGFTVLGPFLFLVDLLWISSDPRRQALRDKVAHTFVIRQHAVPVGIGRVVYPTYTLFGWTLVFAEVEPAA